MDLVFETEQLVLRGNPQLLSDSSLSNLRRYKYSSVDRSLLARLILNRFWVWCAECMPLWLAPNCITLIGISAILICHFFILVFQNGGDLVTPMPRAVYLFFAFAFFFYQTMDNVDGKQARRTGTSSPLGELFDHGIDSLNCLWGALIMVSTLSAGSSLVGIVNLLVPTIGMYFSTWETYHTKTLFLDYLNAPTEGLIVAVSFHLAAGLFGPEFLSEKLIPGTSLSIGNLWTIPLILSVLFLHIPSCLRNVYKHDPVEFWNKTADFTTLVYLVLGIVVWAASPSNVIVNLSEYQYKDGHLFLFGWAVAFTFGRISTTVILSHLCNQPFPRNNIPLIMLMIGGLFYGLLPWFGLTWAPISELAYLRLYFTVSGIYFFGFAKLVIDRLTTYLGISAFTVRRY